MLRLLKTVVRFFGTPITIAALDRIERHAEEREMAAYRRGVAVGKILSDI